mmetsp:Transcript_24897/g.33352  ORF Transcript_24897/g.33352 Transcript_24897/m.33352 type:complete len:158 (+) Transcript_24897:602-1075(+)|eukprot:CAMPEP_0185622110 /NCGR_PEP_ID=MMETSP0436-20130131/59026_1 /TAXON_ID=626734 ORGANISM="Favella taraikaensis, Strain Fe Narragansett Bay" /NCGR_SAMPLE_ID=MMETSP0436 /ASSEMBLY_ACC=CAM_ASM_000390 /LENGTH=157 /DNA_ID=CAMNT_0028263779 /DNA_START=2499 /DNA_END=2972 /DNA_ORIENTATION=-
MSRQKSKTDYAKRPSQAELRKESKVSAIQEADDPLAEAESTQNSQGVFAHRLSGATEQQFLMSPLLKVTDGERGTRPSPAQIDNQQKLISKIQTALADQDAFFESYFTSEVVQNNNTGGNCGTNPRRGSSGVTNASLSFRASRPRCSHDTSDCCKPE